MSIDPEDSLLEQALRGDLPSADTEARLRRRMLAAGVAIGNGVATTAAVASGTAAGGVATGGLLAKAAGLSWGIKVGLAAAVAIPTVGLWLDSHATAQAPRSKSDVTLAAASASPLTPPPATKLAPTQVAAASDEPATETVAAAERAPSRAARAANLDATTPSGVDPAHPSQADFGSSEGPARSPEVGSTLAAETRLLDAAFAALAAGNHARAAELLAEHAARYPHGLLQKERERARSKLSELSRGE